jgi:hypothetical protein
LSHQLKRLNSEISLKGNTLKIISRNYNGIDVVFDNSNFLYLNATQTAKEFNKLPADWLRLKDTKAYIQAISHYGNSHNGDLVVVRKGGNDLSLTGTWIHKKLIINFARWLSPEFAVWCDEQIEDILQGSFPLETETDRNLKGLETSIRILNVNEASKILMTKTLYKKIGLETSYLPDYSDEQHTYSLSHLLKKFQIGISAKKLNQILISNEILEIKTRKSTSGEKSFKSLTEKGLEFGKNLISPHNQLETQPHYFEIKFRNLLDLVKL